MAQRTGAVGDARVEDAAVVRADVVLGRAVQQHVHVRADMQVAHLQRAGERKHERHVLLLRQLLAHDFNVRLRSRGQPTRQRRVAVDVELEQVEEGVVDKGNGAVDFALDAVVELERLACLVAYREWRPDDFVFFVGEMFTRFSAPALLVYKIIQSTPKTSTHELRFMHSTGIEAP